MKGIIVKCLQELVVEKFGQDKWDVIAAKVGDMPKTITPVSDIPDEKDMQALRATCEVLGISLQQVADAFGDYWVNVFSQKYYSIYYEKRKNAREFILYMDHVHDTMTQDMEHARPPRFKYEWKDDKTLIFHYTSHRDLIDLAAGLIKGVGKFYKEDLKVKKISDKELEVIFP